MIVVRILLENSIVSYLLYLSLTNNILLSIPHQLAHAEAAGVLLAETAFVPCLYQLSGAAHLERGERAHDVRSFEVDQLRASLTSEVVGIEHHFEPIVRGGLALVENKVLGDEVKPHPFAEEGVVGNQISGDPRVVHALRDRCDDGGEACERSLLQDRGGIESFDAHNRQRSVANLQSSHAHQA